MIASLPAMNFRPSRSLHAIRFGLERRLSRGAALRSAWWVLVLALCASRASAGPYIWDTDENKIDDRIESVNLRGYAFSFENADTLARQRIAVTRAPLGLLYSV